MDFTRTKELLASYKLDEDMQYACLAVTSVLESLNDNDGEFLTLPFFYEQLRSTIPKEKIISALGMLSTFEEAILELNGFMYDNEEQQLHINKSEFNELLQTGKLVHPLTGELVQNPMDQVHLYYSVKQDA